MGQPQGSLQSCVLRAIFASPVLHDCAAVTSLAENMLRSMATASDQNLGGPGRELPSDRPAQEVVELSEGSSPALLVPITTGGTPQAQQAAPSAAAEAAVPQALRLAVSAADGLSEDVLISLAERCAAAKRPLTAAFALERLRLATTLLDKTQWRPLVAQVRPGHLSAGRCLPYLLDHTSFLLYLLNHTPLALQVLQAAIAAEAEPSHALDVVAVWLEVLGWIADSRWRRLPAGPQSVELLSLLEALDLRVLALSFMDRAEVRPHEEEGSPRGEGLLSAAGARLKSLRIRERPAGPQEAEGEAGSDEPRFGQKLSRGFKSLLSRGKEGREGGGREAEEGAAGPSSRGAPAGLAERAQGTVTRKDTPAQLATPPKAPGHQGQQTGRLSPVHEVPLAPAGTSASSDTGSAHDAAAGRPGGFRRRVAAQLAAVKSRIGRRSTEASGSGPPSLDGSRGGGGSRRAAARGQQGAAGQREREAALERQLDEVVRQALAAFAVGAYIRSVLCPSLPIPRTTSGAGCRGQSFREFVCVRKPAEWTSHVCALPRRRQAAAPGFWTRRCSRARPPSRGRPRRGPAARTRAPSAARAACGRTTCCARWTW